MKTKKETAVQREIRLCTVGRRLAKVAKQLLRACPAEDGSLVDLWAEVGSCQRELRPRWLGSPSKSSTFVCTMSWNQVPVKGKKK